MILTENSMAMAIWIRGSAINGDMLCGCYSKSIQFAIYPLLAPVPIVVMMPRWAMVIHASGTLMA